MTRRWQIKRAGFGHAMFAEDDSALADDSVKFVMASDYDALAARLAEADALLRVVTAHSLDLDADLLQRVSDHFRAIYSASGRETVSHD